MTTCAPAPATQEAPAAPAGPAAPRLGSMLIAEELFLLLRRNDGHPEDSFAYSSYGLTAAAVVDLILAGRVGVSAEEDPRLTVVTQVPAGHPVLDAVLDRLRAEPGRTLSEVVSDPALDVEKATARTLADAGVIGIEAKRFLGLVPAKYPLLDGTAEDAARRRLRAVLAGGTPAAADAVLLSILQGLDVAAKVLTEERGDLGPDGLRRRITEVSGEVGSAGSAAGAVTQAVEVMNAALLAAVFIPAVIAGGAANS